MYAGVSELEQIPYMVEINDQIYQMDDELRHIEDSGYVYRVDGTRNCRHLKCEKCGKEWQI